MFLSLWQSLKTELNLTDEDLIMPSAVLAYTRNNNGGTDVTCKNIFSGKCVTRTLQVDPTQLVEWSLNPRALVQDVFPHLTASEREFLMTGCTDEDWNAMFGDDDGL